MNEGFTRNLEEEAHGFNKWQLELLNINIVCATGASESLTCYRLTGMSTFPPRGYST